MKPLATAAMLGAIEGPGERLRILEAARSGNLGAFDVLMRQHQRLVLATALRLLGNMEDAKDASQEVFLRLYRNLGKLGDSANLPAWLYKVTVNVCHDLCRRRPAQERVEEDLAADAAGPHEELTAAERRRALELSLRRLSEREREAVVLRDLEGLTTEEVARIMGSTEATVRSQISQARVKMKAFIESYFRRRR